MCIEIGPKKAGEMGKVTLAAALFFSVITCELVVTPEDESNLSSEYLLDHAEVVSRYQQSIKVSRYQSVNVSKCQNTKLSARPCRYCEQVPARGPLS